MIEDTKEPAMSDTTKKAELEEGLRLLAATHEGGQAATINFEFWMNKYASNRGVKSVFAQLLAELPKGTTLCIR